MGYITSKLVINKDSLSDYQLDVSGNILFDGLLNMNGRRIQSIGALHQLLH
jgi:hypothetical protein